MKLIALGTLLSTLVLTGCYAPRGATVDEYGTVRTYDTTDPAIAPGPAVSYRYAPADQPRRIQPEMPPWPGGVVPLPPP